MIATILKHPLPLKESRFAADVLFTKVNITVFIYHHMQTSIYHATYDPIKLERSRPILWCAPALSASLNDLIAMFMSENNSSEDKNKKPAS